MRRLKRLKIPNFGGGTKTGKIEIFPLQKFSPELGTNSSFSWIYHRTTNLKLFDIACGPDHCCDIEPLTLASSRLFECQNIIRDTTANLRQSCR
jgi:hypothetical protein